MTPAALYHVASPGFRLGVPLRSLYARYGDDAYGKFARRWPRLDYPSADARKIFFFDTPETARRFPRPGPILKVDTSQMEGLYFDPTGFWVTEQDVPAASLSYYELDPLFEPDQIHFLHGTQRLAAVRSVVSDHLGERKGIVTCTRCGGNITYMFDGKSPPVGTCETFGCLTL